MYPDFGPKHCPSSLGLRKGNFNHRLLLLETFVDSRFFKGTCYKASNWLHTRNTYGSTKQGKEYRYHGIRKEIYLYVIEPEFREIIGCRQKPAPLPYRPPQTKKQVEELTMILKHCQWHPKISAEFDLSQDDVETMAQELLSFHKQFHDCYGRIEHHRLGLAYLSGLMSNAEAKSAERIALEFLDKKSRTTGPDVFEDLRVGSFRHAAYPSGDACPGGCLP